MKKVVRRARAKGGMTLYLPTERRHGVALPVDVAHRRVEYFVPIPDSTPD